MEKGNKFCIIYLLDTEFREEHIHSVKRKTIKREFTAHELLTFYENR